MSDNLFTLVLVPPDEAKDDAELVAAVTRLMRPLEDRVCEWWCVGGKYDGLVQGSARCGRPRTMDALKNNMRVVNELPADFSCHILVLPTGVWFEGPMKLYGQEEGMKPEYAVAIRKQFDAWQRELYALLLAHADHIAVGLTCHY
jgi:hypothetical protein